MKALVLDRPGKPNSLRVDQVPIPPPGYGEIRVRVHAAGLNPVDYKVAASGHTNWTYPFVLGLDVAGVIDAVGEGVEDWKVGDKVFYHGDLTKLGGYAEFAITTAHTVAPLPIGLSFADAAALPCAGLTAYQALYHKASLENKQDILIHAGAGGVGGFAIQLAALAGVKVISTASSRNAEYVISLGAHEVIDYQSEDVTERVMQLTDGRGAGIVLNTISGKSAAEDFERLAFNGHLICIAGLPDLNSIKLSSKATSVHAVALGMAHQSGNYLEQKQLAHMANTFGELASQRKIHPMLTETVTIDQIPDALGRLSERHVRGKIVAVI